MFNHRIVNGGTIKTCKRRVCLKDSTNFKPSRLFKRLGPGVRAWLAASSAGLAFDLGEVTSRHFTTHGEKPSNRRFWRPLNFAAWRLRKCKRKSKSKWWQFVLLSGIGKASRNFRQGYMRKLCIACLMSSSASGGRGGKTTLGPSLKIISQ